MPKSKEELRFEQMLAGLKKYAAGGTKKKVVRKKSTAKIPKVAPGQGFTVTGRLPQHKDRLMVGVNEGPKMLKLILGYAKKGKYTDIKVEVLPKGDAERIARLLTT